MEQPAAGGDASMQPSTSSHAPPQATPESDASTSPPGFPVRTKIFRRMLQGVPTDFSYSLYTDRVLIFITQTGTAGTILSATQDAAFDGSTTFTTAVLMGKRDEPLLQLCARQIVEAASGAGMRRPMLIGLGLKTHTLPLVKEIMAAVSADNVWS